jgi:hypothetical protein
LLNKSSTKPLETLPGTSDPVLDRPLTLKELTDVIFRAKWGKACGPDRIQIELLKHASPAVVKILFDIMQLIFKNAIFPNVWTINYLKAIYKKGSKDDPDNYRGLAIAPAISKIYCTILLQRLETHVTKNKIISLNQIGFQRGYRASDHIYLLKTIVNKILTRGKRLYAAFIDFKKAYDTVDRSILLKSLHNSGIQGNFLFNLQAMYQRVSYSIKTNGRTMNPIESNLGLKQGCPLSPLLFNIYINDIGDYLKDNEEGDLSVYGTNINHFLYADDLVLLADSKEKLQEHLYGLSEFAKAKELTVSTKKSVVMVFSKSGRKTSDTFSYNNTKLESVQSFTYLGVDISASGSFSSGIKSLVTKAKKAMIPLYRTIVQFDLPFKNVHKMFTSLIEPILLYNSENWACMTSKEIERCKNDNNRIYELTLGAPATIAQLKFLKFALGVNKQCPTMAVLGETAEVPLLLKGFHRMLTYWNRTKEMGDETLVKKAYLENVASNSNWCQTIQILNSSHDLHNGDIEEAKFFMVARKRLRDNFTKYWRNRIDDRSKEKKLHFYSQVKHEFTMDQYLDLPAFRDRQRITKFITSDHCLGIEKGRHNNKPREERVCKACDGEAIEDEEHFILDCAAYKDIRQSCLNFQTPPGIGKDDRIRHIFRSNNPTDINNYLATALKHRDKLVNFHVTELSLCFMRITIRRGADTRTAKSSTKLQTNILDNNKMRISRKGTRLHPYTRPSKPPPED